MNKNDKEFYGGFVENILAEEIQKQGHTKVSFR